MTDNAKNKWFCRKVGELKHGMYTFAISILKNESDADDALQNTLLTAYQHIDQLKFTEKFKPWIYKILSNECFHIINKREFNENIDEINFAADTKGDFETKETLWNVVNSMEINYRTVIILFYYENMSIKDIAKSLDISTDNVKQRLTRARTRLKSLLNQEDFYE